MVAQGQENAYFCTSAGRASRISFPQKHTASTSLNLPPLLPLKARDFQTKLSVFVRPMKTYCLKRRRILRRVGWADSKTTHTHHLRCLSHELLGWLSPDGGHSHDPAHILTPKIRATLVAQLLQSVRSEERENM